jgi:hypothetical protein
LVLPTRKANAEKPKEPVEKLDNSYLPILRVRGRGNCLYRKWLKPLYIMDAIHSPRFKPWAMEKRVGKSNRFNGLRFGILKARCGTEPF